MYINIREDHERQIDVARAERAFGVAEHNLKEVIENLRLKKDEIAKETILKTVFTGELMVFMMTTGYFFAVEVNGGYYDESASLDVCSIPIDVALQVGVITDDGAEEYLRLKNEWQRLTKEARENAEIALFIKRLGADKVREVLG